MFVSPIIADLGLTKATRDCLLWTNFNTNFVFVYWFWDPAHADKQGLMVFIYVDYFQQFKLSSTLPVVFDSSFFKITLGYAYLFEICMDEKYPCSLHTKAFTISCERILESDTILTVLFLQNDFE